MPSSEEEISQTGLHALKCAYETQRRLFLDGEIAEFVSKGKGTDKATRGDWESEEIVISSLRDSGLPARIISEEHGEIDLVSRPKYLVVLDGFDGSSGLVKNPNARGGTMLSIAKCLNPRYDDFVFSGLTERTQDTILYSGRDRGTFLLYHPGDNSEIRKLEKVLKSSGRIHVDDKQFYPDYQERITKGIDDIARLTKITFSDKLQGRFELSGLVSSSAMTLDFAKGAVDAVCGVIAKGVFEPPVQYLITKELHGEVLAFVDGKWQDIGDKYWSEFGRPISPLLLCSSKKTSEELVKILLR